MPYPYTYTDNENGRGRRVRRRRRGLNIVNLNPRRRRPRRPGAGRRPFIIPRPGGQRPDGGRRVGRRRRGGSGTETPTSQQGGPIRRLVRRGRRAVADRLNRAANRRRSRSR